jgi:hypothetical protein
MAGTSIWHAESACVKVEVVKMDDTILVAFHTNDAHVGVGPDEMQRLIDMLVVARSQMIVARQAT